MPYADTQNADPDLLALMTAAGGEPPEHMPDALADAATYPDHDPYVVLPEFRPVGVTCPACDHAPPAETISEYTWKLWRCPACGTWHDKFPQPDAQQ